MKFFCSQTHSTSRCRKITWTSGSNCKDDRGLRECCQGSKIYVTQHRIQHNATSTAQNGQGSNDPEPYKQFAKRKLINLLWKKLWEYGIFNPWISIFRTKEQSSHWWEQNLGTKISLAQFHHGRDVLRVVSQNTSLSWGCLEKDTKTDGWCPKTPYQGGFFQAAK